MATVPSHAPARCTIEVPTGAVLALERECRDAALWLGYLAAERRADHAASPNSDSFIHTLFEPRYRPATIPKRVFVATSRLKPVTVPLPDDARRTAWVRHMVTQMRIT